VRLAVMNMLAAHLPEARWLDLFCGSGVMGCEALQRGAQQVVAVDQDRRNLATARANLEAVAAGLERPVRVEVVQQEVLRWLRSKSAGSTAQGEGLDRFDLIYADPPYASGPYVSVAEAVLQGGWLAPQGLLLMECSSQAIPELAQGWELVKQKRYGTSSLLVLRQQG
jgi:16S rRNA (guanine(966)-N(2))-methyltransferase RsmD